MRPAAPGCSQGSPVPQVPRHISKRVVRRADLFSLQKLERMAERCAAYVPSLRQQTLKVNPGPRHDMRGQSEVQKLPHSAASELSWR